MFKKIWICPEIIGQIFSTNLKKQIFYALFYFLPLHWTAFSPGKSVSTFSERIITCPVQIVIFGPRLHTHRCFLHCYFCLLSSKYFCKSNRSLAQKIFFAPPFFFPEHRFLTETDLIIIILSYLSSKSVKLAFLLLYLSIPASRNFSTVILTFPQALWLKIEELTYSLDTYQRLAPFFTLTCFILFIRFICIFGYGSE